MKNFQTLRRAFIALLKYLTRREERPTFDTYGEIRRPTFTHTLFLS